MEAMSVLYWLLKVAVPQIRGERVVERGGWVGGIFFAGGWWVLFWSLGRLQLRARWMWLNGLSEE